MRIPSSLSLAPLRLALREAAAAAAAEDDPALRELSAAMGRLLGDAEVEAAGSEELRLRERLLVIGERASELRLRVEAAACLRRADPELAQAAQHLLDHLPWPPRRTLSEEETLIPGSLSAETVERGMAPARALLDAAAAPPAAEHLGALGLLPLCERLAALLAEAGALSARHRPGGSGWPGEAAELLARYRAYVVVATGKLAPGGEDPARRQRLLTPLWHL